MFNVLGRFAEVNRDALWCYYNNIRHDVYNSDVQYADGTSRDASRVTAVVVERYGYSEKI